MNFRKTVRLLIALALMLALAGGASADEPRAFESSPETFFASHSPAQLTLIITIGLSGSGKTYWSKIGTASGWEHIDVDAVIANEIDRTVRRKEVAAEINADPRKAVSANSYALRKSGQKKAKEQADAFLDAKRSLIWDSLGFDSVRQELTKKAKSCGFEVWWLVFSPEDWKRSRANVILRESKGEPLRRPPTERCVQLSKLLKQQSGYLKDLLADTEKNPSHRPDQIFFAHVADLSAQLPGGDPCVGAEK